MIPNPGSMEAVRAGCTCNVVDNDYGRGWYKQPGQFVYNEDCPLHFPVNKIDCSNQSDSSSESTADHRS